MHPRPIWIARLQRAWRHAPIVWLSGVRRSGKTTLARALEGATYLNCDLPSVAARLADPEAFFESLATETVVFDDDRARALFSRYAGLASAARTGAS